MNELEELLRMSNELVEVGYKRGYVNALKKVLELPLNDRTAEIIGALLDNV